MKTEPGQVYRVDLGIAAKTRMFIVVSMADAAAPRATTACVPITTAHRGSWYEIPLGRKPFLREQSWANVQGIQALGNHTLQGPVGRVHPAEMEAIRDAARQLRTRDLSGCVLVSTSRPCRMCEAAAGWAGISRMVYGETLTDAGAPR